MFNSKELHDIKNLAEDIIDINCRLANTSLSVTDKAILLVEKALLEKKLQSFNKGA